MESCKTLGITGDDHFREVTKMIQLGLRLHTDQSPPLYDLATPLFLIKAPSIFHIVQDEIRKEKEIICK